MTLIPGQTYSWIELSGLFLFKPNYFSSAGGMISRPEQETLLLITHPDGGKQIDYRDYWDDDGTLVYKGRGQIGDQKYQGLNKALGDNSYTNILLEGAGPKALRFLGVATCKEYWWAEGPDREGHERRELRYRLVVDKIEYHLGDRGTGKEPKRRAAQFFSAVEASHIYSALEELDSGIDHPFGLSTKYDLLHRGRRYPPKAVMGLAVRHACGEEVGPGDFSGGLNTACFRTFERCGFMWVPKELTDEEIDSFPEGEELQNWLREGKADGGQGWIQDPKEKVCIELYAMEKAENYFKELGFVVEDVSRKRGYGCDLHGRKESGDLYIEVKGTKSAGTKVQVTINEVEKAKDRSPATSLFIVHAIEVNKGDEGYVATGGICRNIQPFQPDQWGLFPKVFEIDVSEKLEPTD